MADKSELLQLIELAVKKGFSYTELLSDLSNYLLLYYYQNYPRTTPHAQLFIDGISGNIRLIADEKDITPPDFSKTGPTVARQYILNKLNQVPGNLAISKSPVNSLIGSTRWIPAVIFWGYNLIFILIFILISIPLVNHDTRSQFIEFVKNLSWFKRILLASLIISPVYSIFQAIHDHSRVGRLFFLFEVPTIFISLLLYSVVDNPILPIQYFCFLLLIIPLILYQNYLFEQPNKTTHRLLIFQHILYQTIFLSLTYISLLWLFFIPPVVSLPLSGILRSYQFGYSLDAFNLIYGIVGSSLLIILTVMPYLLIVIFGRSWWNSLQSLLARFTRIQVDLIVFSPIVGLLIIFGLFSYQPKSHKYLDLLGDYGVSTTFNRRLEIASSLISHQSDLKQQILDQYDAHRRYLFVQDDTFLSDSYKQIINFPDNLASNIQTVFLALAYPFVYHGQTNSFNNLLSEYYQDLFGQSIYQTSNYSRSTSVQYVNLVGRQITINTTNQDALAITSIEDEFSNNTFQDQEVTYEFSLPNDAVVTDLKLGANLEYQGIIAPIGAASTTFQQEVNRRRDPALLEQIGPRQYRLRLYPVPAKVSSSTSITSKNLKVKFSYVSTIQSSGYPLPNYSQVTNLNQTKLDKFILSFNNQTSSLGTDQIYYRPSTLNQILSNLCRLTTPLSGKTSTSNLFSSLVRPSNLTCNSQNQPIVTPVTNKKIAILYDVSFDNKDNKHYPELTQFIKNNSSLLENNLVEFYQFNQYLSPAQVLKPSTRLNLTYFGKNDLINAMNSLNQKVDAAIIITSSVTPSITNNSTFNLGFPVYFIFDDSIPALPQSLTQNIVKNGGLIVDEMTQAINHLSLNNNLYYFGSYFQINTNVGSVPSDLTNNPSDPLNYLVSRNYILELLRSYPGNIYDMTFLDNIHQLAKKTSVVTPYSSLIALVNQQQLNNLDSNSQYENRYQQNVQSAPGQLRSALTFGGITTPSFSDSSGAKINLVPGGGSQSFSPMSSLSYGSGLPILLIIVLAGPLLFGTVIYLFRLTKKH